MLTLGDGVSGVIIFSTLLDTSVIFCNASRVGSSASKLGVVVEGRDVRMVIMSVATCLRK